MEAGGGRTVRLVSRIEEKVHRLDEVLVVAVYPLQGSVVTGLALHHRLAAAERELDMRSRRLVEVPLPAARKGRQQQHQQQTI